MRIAIDIDGVLRNFQAAIVDRYAETHFQTDRIIEYENWEWNLVNNFPDYTGTAKQFYDWWSLTEAPEIMINAKRMPGALSAFKFIQNETRHTPVIVSSQRKGTEQYTLEWLGLNGFNSTETHFSKNKLKSNINCEAIIDDKTENLQDYKNAGKIAIAISHPWNVEWEGLVFKSLREASEYIALLS